MHFEYIYPAIYYVMFFTLLEILELAESQFCCWAFWFGYWPSALLQECPKLADPAL